MTSNNQGRFHFRTLLFQKQHCDTLHSYRDNESISLSNLIHKSQKTAKRITPIAAVNESVRDSSIPNHLPQFECAATQTETPSIHEKPFGIKILLTISIIHSAVLKFAPMLDQNKENIPIEGEDFYFTPEGYKCFTEKFHLKRGYCCKSGCRHCPYGFDKKTGNIKK